MKKHGSSICIILLVCVLAACLSACNPSGELPKGKPIAWESYLDKVVDSLIESAELEDGRFRVEVAGTIDGTDTDRSFYFGLNYNANNIDDSLLVTELSENGKNVFSIKSNNDHTYMDIAPNDLMGDAKLKLENVNLFTWLSSAFKGDGGESDAKSALRELLKNAGRMLFVDVVIDPSRAGYGFVIDQNGLWKETSAKYFDALTSVLDEKTLEIFYKIMKCEDRDDFLSKLPVMDGIIFFEMNEGKVTEIDSSRLQTEEGEAQVSLKVDIGGGSIDDLIERFPASDEGFKVTKVGNSYVSGSLSLITSDGNKRAIKYDYSLNVNVDLIKLALSDYKLSALDEDNFFHFRLSHVCDGHCTEFCRSKLEPSEGAVLDIAFSPKDFGTHNVYISAGAKALFGDYSLKRVGLDLDNVYTSLLAPYMLFTIPDTALDKGSPYFTLFERLYINSAVGEGRFNITKDELVESFKEDSLLAFLLDGMLISEEYDNDVLSFTVDESVYGQAGEYDIYKQTVFIIENSLGKSKVYGNALSGYDYTKLGWTYLTQSSTLSGETLTDIYDASGNKIHGVENGRYIPMSPIEADNLAGKYINFTYTDLEKNTKDKDGNDLIGRAEIVGVENLNLDARGAQTVTLTVRYPSCMDNLYYKALLGDFADVFTDKINVSVRLTDEVDFSLDFSQNFDDKNIKVVTKSKDAPGFLKASVSLKYVNGGEKRMEVEGISDKVYREEGYFNTVSYSVLDWGETHVKFDVFGRTIKRTYTIQEPDRTEFYYKRNPLPYEVEAGSTFYFNYLTNHCGLYVYYDDVLDDNGTPKPIDLMLTPGDVYVNDIPLNQSSSDWKVKPTILSDSAYNSNVVFYKSNDYFARIRKHGLVSDAITIRVVPKGAQTPRYKYTYTTVMPEFYFTGATYTVYGNISNSSHGETDDTASEFSLSVMRGNLVVDSNGNGNVSFNENVTFVPSVVALSLTVGGNSTTNEIAAENATGIGFPMDVPAFIKNPISVKFSFNIKEPGYYRIVFKMTKNGISSFSQEWKIYVGEL